MKTTSIALLKGVLAKLQCFPCYYPDQLLLAIDDPKVVVGVGHYHRIPFFPRPLNEGQLRARVKVVIYY